MKFVAGVAVCAALATLAGAVAAPADTEKERKEYLLTLYLISLAADRCGFPMTRRQSDALDRATEALAESLKLRDWQTDAIFSEADIAFEKQGPKACDRNGGFARIYKETLQKLTGP
jgi:hypothetical protein